MQEFSGELGDMKIDILAREGSPLGVTVKSIYGQDGRIGVGGAELALLTMCEAWQEAGHQVTLYNSPKDFTGSPFRQMNVRDFNSQENRDILIIFRSPVMRLDRAKGLKVWWSCDQQTTGSFATFSRMVDVIVCISQNHADYFMRTYDIQDAVVIDLPVRLKDYEREVEKVPGRVLFSSVPDRGLRQMRDVWDVVSAEMPEAELIVTSDYRLWGSPFPNNEQYRLMYARAERVNFRGGVLRDELIDLQLSSEVLAYPCIYDELFCIAVAEAQVAGAYPITSSWGSLPTTNMGTILDGNPTSRVFTDAMALSIMNFLEKKTKQSVQKEVQKKAKSRFSPERIMKEWDEKVFK